MALGFTTKHRELDFAGRTVNFVCVAENAEIPCRVSFDALAVYYGIATVNRANLLAAFDENRDHIETAAASRHGHGLKERDGSIFIEADDLAGVGSEDDEVGRGG